MFEQSFQKDTFCLFRQANQTLALKTSNGEHLQADFHVSTWRQRRIEGKKQALIRACKPKPGLHILDATAGWGRDSAILASFGAEVLMIERNPIMAALLSDALSQQSEQDKQDMKLSLFSGDAKTFLKSLKIPVDVVYIDPMHPMRRKSALVKKDLQVLQKMIGPDEDALELIQLAIQSRATKVVVKWPQRLKPLIPTDTFIPGKTVRFDIYVQ